MSEPIITNEAVNYSFILDYGHAVVKEETPCGVCGDDLEEGQQAVEVYAPMFDQLGSRLAGFRTVETVHLRCSAGEKVCR